MNFLKRFGDWLVTFFALAFGTACILLSVYGFYSTIFSVTWLETEAKIVNSYPVKNNKGNSYRPEVSYVYQVNEITYEGNVLKYDGSILPTFASKETIEKRLLPYQKEVIVKVYYNPFYPAQSCIERGGGLTMQFITLLLGIVLIYVGISEIRSLLKISRNSQFL